MTAAQSKKTYDLSDVLIDEKAIASRVRELGADIARDYEGRSVILVGILKGCVPFIADLMRAIDLEGLEVDFISVSSYGRSTQSSGVVRILKDLDCDIKGKDVIIVEDIIDSGLTLSYLKEYFEGRNPNSLRICALLDKPSRRKTDIRGDYIGFEVEDKFIVGYGLDMNQRYRHLPFVTWVKEEK